VLKKKLVEAGREQEEAVCGEQKLLEACREEEESACREHERTVRHMRHI
jgi:hypothetical protein